MKSKHIVLIVVLIVILITATVLFRVDSHLNVNLDFAESIEIAYENSENEITYIKITDNDDVTAMKTVFSGTAIKSDTIPYMCAQGALTDLKFIGASETFVITIDCHGGAIPENFEGDIPMNINDRGKLEFIISKYITDMSTDQDWFRSDIY